MKMLPSLILRRGARRSGLLLVACLAASCSNQGDAAVEPASEAASTALSANDPATTESSQTTVDGVEALNGSVEIAGGDVTVVEMGSDGTPPLGSTVLFLHGAAFTSQTWVDNGILASVAAAGHRAVAIDLPGSGSSDDIDLDEEVVLAALFEALELDPSRTVIVSPSMSGIYSLPALRMAGFANLAGYVPVAPSGASSFADDGPPVDVPALLVWGDGDGNDPQAAAERLGEGFTDAEVLILADAGHAAYEQQPQAFTDALLTFVAGLQP